MEKEKTFAERELTSIPKPVVVGYREVTAEERAMCKARFEEMLISKGKLKEGEHLTDEEYSKYLVRV